MQFQISVLCFLNFFTLFYVYVYEPVCVYAGAQGCQKRASDPLKLSKQVAVSCQVWVLGTELGSSAKEATNH